MKKLFWLLYITAVLIAVCAITKCTTCKAETLSDKVFHKIDTCHVNVENIEAFYITTNEKTGKDRYFIAYCDVDQGIDDLIPISTSLYEYVMTCHAMKIAPHLGVVFRDNTPSRIIKYRKMGYYPKKLPETLKIYRRKVK